MDVYLDCIDCRKPHKRKKMNKYTQGYLCRRCYLKSSSENAFITADREVRRARRLKKPLTTWEERVLYSMYEQKKISYSEMEQRKRDLKDSIKRNNSLALIKQHINKTTFQEEFAKLKNKS